MNIYCLKAQLPAVLRVLRYASVLLLLALLLFSTPGISSKTLSATTDQLGTWNKVTSPDTYAHKSVDMISDTDGWIVGFESFAGSYPVGSVMLHWDGSSWSRITSPNALPLLSVDMISATDGWAGGGFPHGQGEFLHWDGSTWSEASHPTFDGTINAITMRTASDGWAVGGYWTGGNSTCKGSILHWDGSSWNIMLSNALNFYFRSVTAISENDVWLAGSYCHWTPGIPGTMTNGAVLGHWNGTTWNITVQGQPTFGFYSIDAINSNDVWAVGSYGWIAHWDGNQWSKIQSPVGYNLWSVAMTSPSDGWATGASQNPSILHWDGSTWEIVGAPSSGGLLDIQMLSSNDGWAVGYGGDILHYTYDTNSSHIFLPLVVR